MKSAILFGILAATSLTATATELNQWSRNELTATWNRCVDDSNMGLTDDSEEDCKRKVRQRRDEIVQREARIKAKQEQQRVEYNTKVKAEQAKAKKEAEEQAASDLKIANDFHATLKAAKAPTVFAERERSVLSKARTLKLPGFSLTYNKGRLSDDSGATISVDMHELEVTDAHVSLTRDGHAFVNGNDGGRIPFNPKTGLIATYDIGLTKNIIEVLRQTQLNHVVINMNNQPIGVITRSDMKWLMTY